MKKIIEGFNSIPDRDLIDCRITSIRDILNYYNIDMDSFILLALSGGCLFTFQSVKVKNLNLWVAMGSSDNLEEVLLNNLTIKFTKHDFPNDDSGYARMRSFIDDDNPIIVVFDSNYIHENAYQKDLNKEYFSNLSSAVLVGYDTDRSMVYLNLKDEKEKDLHEMGSKEFMIARNTKCLPCSPKNICYSIEVDDIFRDNLKGNLKAMLRESINEFCGSMLNSKASNRDKYHGINGINRLADALLEFKDELYLNKGIVQEAILDKVFIMKIGVLRGSMLPGSNTIYREEYGKSLEKASLILGNKEIKKIGDGFISIGRDWRKLIRLLANANYKTQEKESFLITVSSILKQISEKELGLCNRLKDAINE